MTQRLDNPFPLFLDSGGALLHNGFVYMGEPGQDPETHPIATFWDDDLTVAAAQPFRTRGGVIVNGTNPAFVYADGEDYSIRVRDADGGEIYFLSSVAVTGVEYQPLDSDLTAIASLTTTSFGRTLLTLANQAAMKAALGYVEPVPAAGGNVTGNIVRQGGGVHLYHNDPAMISGKILNTGPTGTDPTVAVGDIWFKDIAS